MKTQNVRVERIICLLDAVLFVLIVLLLTAVAIRLTWNVIQPKEMVPVFEQVSWRPPLVIVRQGIYPGLPRAGSPGWVNPHPENPFNVRDYCNPFLYVCP
jgi:hypothetical protein